VPGVMALVLVLICVLMTSASIVGKRKGGRWKYAGFTFNPLLVIISKAVPYFFLSLINLNRHLLLSVFLLHLPVKGSIAYSFWKVAF
jgi:ABC-2 type transport system permease protein